MTAWRPYAVLVGLLAGAAALTALSGKVSQVSEAGIVMKLPERLGEWVGVPMPVMEVERQGLPVDTEFERRLYRDARGNEVYCSIVLAGKDARSIHRPETCLPAQGWEVLDGRYEDVPVNAGGVAALRTRALKIVRRLQAGGMDGSVERLNYYWFMGKDRVTASHIQRIVWNSFDRIVHSVNHRWAYITLTVAVPRGGGAAAAAANEAAARAAMRGFIGRLFPELKRAVPASSV
ncbi:MAG: EpsI family protein [Verrucomicrobia bacterium]|nr:EpsI family protein [Verrucomicrobiota bacterium]